MNYQCSRIYKTEKLSKAKDCIFQNTAAVGILPFPLPRKECCCVFKRKRYPWTIVRSNIKLGGGRGGVEWGFSLRRAVDLEIILLRKVVCIYEKTFSSSFVRDFRDGLITARLFCL